MNSSDDDHFNDDDKSDKYNIIHNKATDSDVKNSYNDEKNTAELNNIAKKAMKMSQVCNETDAQLIISKYKKNTMKRKRRASYRSEKIMCFSLRILVSN